MENILDSSYDEPDLDSRSFTKPSEKSETEDNNDDEDMPDGHDAKDMKIDFRRSLSSQDNADNDTHRRKDYRSKKEIEEEEREKMQWVQNEYRNSVILTN